MFLARRKPVARAVKQYFSSVVIGQEQYVGSATRSWTHH